MDLHYNHKDMGALAKSKNITIDCTINDNESLPETSLGERVRKLRLINKLTLKDLANLSKIEPETISNIEKSKRIPNISTLTRLSQGLSSNNCYLLGADSWPETSPGEIIYKYRMISGLSQANLAEKCNLHKSTIKDYEDGKIRYPETLKIIYKEIGYIIEGSF